MAFTRADFHKKKMNYHLLLSMRATRLGRETSLKFRRKRDRYFSDANKHWIKHLVYAAKVKVDEANLEISQNLEHFINNETEQDELSGHTPTAPRQGAGDEIAFDDDEPQGADGDDEDDEG